MIARESHPKAIFTPTNAVTTATVVMEAIRGHVYVTIEGAGPGANEGTGFSLDHHEASCLADLLKWTSACARCWKP